MDPHPILEQNPYSTGFFESILKHNPGQPGLFGKPKIVLISLIIE